MNPSRLLVLTELFLPTKGGTAVWFDEVYRRLGGKEVHIVTAEVPGGREHDASHPNSVHRLALRRHAWLRPESLAMYAKLLLRSLSLAWRGRFDAVHAGRVLPEGLVGLATARVIRRPFVVYSHGEEITTWLQSWKFRAMRYVYGHADVVIANSEFTRDELVRIGVRSERIRIIYPGVDLERFRPRLPCADLRDSLRMRPGQRLVLSVGRLSRRKGFDQVILALPDLLARGIDVQFAVIGIGEDRQRLEALAQERGLGERVHLLGHVSAEDLPRWYNAADVVAMPNREIDGDTEGFGLVFLEAAACGKPAIAGLAGGTGAAVVDGVTGLRVDGRSVEAVSGALARVLGDAEFAAMLGKSAHARAVQAFGWSRVAEATANLGRELGGSRAA